MDQYARSKLLTWLDSKGDSWIETTCSRHGVIAGLNLAAVQPNVDSHRFEGSRRMMLHYAFGLAGVVERTACPDVVTAGPESPVEDYRFDAAVQTKPLPDEIREWWAANRGWVRLNCSMHGVLLRVDAARTPTMLAPIWDAYVIERETQKRSVWSDSVEQALKIDRMGPDLPYCNLRIESEQDLPTPFPVVERRHVWEYGFA